jgi:hypothetical protein
MSFTVTPEYNHQPRYPKIVAVVDRWLLFRCTFIFYIWETGPQNNGRCRQVVSSGLTVCI